MTTPAQFLFKKIILHNKLMDEASIDYLIAEVPEPEQAIQRMVKDKVLPIQRANPLLDMYCNQLQKLRDEGHDMDALEEEIERQESLGSEGSPKKDEELKNLPYVDSPVQRAQTRDINSFEAPKALHPMIARLLKIGRKAGASDVHMIAGEIAQFRCAGQLYALEGETPFAPEACERGLLALLAVDHCEHFLRTGDLDFCYDAGRTFGRYRVNIMQRQGGVHGTFHIIPTRIFTFEQLQLPPDIELFTQCKDGMVLITGLRGSGKTATLAALIDRINDTQAKRIISIENPIGNVHSSKESYVIQREVGSHTKSFEAGIRTALRTPVDIIAIDELGDLQAIRQALAAAETGRTIFAVSSAPDAACAIEWLINSFPPGEQASSRSRIAGVMKGVVSQRLVPGPDGNSIGTAVEIFADATVMGKLIRAGETRRLQSTPTAS